MQAVRATYYGDDAAKPMEAEIAWLAAERMEVRVDGRTEFWDLRSKTFVWEESAGAMRVMHGQPRHAIVVRDAATLSAWKSHFKTLKLRPGREDRAPLLFSAAMIIPVGAILFLLALYFWVLPWASEKLVMRAPISLDERMGEAMYPSTAASLRIDEERSKHLQAFADRLSIAPSFRLKLHLADDPQVNAFAMPGGHIVVYSGILEKMTSADQLAALLAHEGTHVERRHSTRGIARAAAGSLFIAMVFGEAGDAVGIAAAKGDELKGLSYSRDLETEADTLGMRRLHANGVDPQGVVRLLELLRKEADDMPEGVAFLSSHPLAKDRIAVAEAKALELGTPIVKANGLDSMFKIVKLE